MQSILLQWMSSNNHSTKKSSSTPFINNTHSLSRMRSHKKEKGEREEDAITTEEVALTKEKTKEKTGTIIKVNPNQDQSRPEFLKRPLINIKRSLKLTNNFRKSTTTHSLITWTPREQNTRSLKSSSQLQIKTEFHKAVFLHYLHILTKFLY